MTTVVTAVHQAVNKKMMTRIWSSNLKIRHQKRKQLDSLMKALDEMESMDVSDLPDEEGE